jgi:hypothetical protein
MLGTTAFAYTYDSDLIYKLRVVNLNIIYEYLYYVESDINLSTNK